MTCAFWASVSLFSFNFWAPPTKKASYQELYWSEKKKQSGSWKYFSQNAGIKNADMERKTSNTWDKHSHKYPVKPSFHQDFLFLSCITHWNKKTILIVFSQTSFKLEPNNKPGMLGFPEHGNFLGNSIISFFNLTFYIFSFHYKAFKWKCSSTDKQVPRPSEWTNTYCWV